MEIERQLQDNFGLKDPVCEHLNTLTNDIVAVTTPAGRFALKLYNSASRSDAQVVQWELDLTAHLVEKGAPVVKPVRGKNGYVTTFIVDGVSRLASLFEWAPGEKPKPEHSTYVLLGKAAAQIHQAADSFSASFSRDKYDAATLIDEQLKRMKTQLEEVGRWQQVVELSERLKKIIANPALDWGICHMDLTLDNVHRDGDTLTVFDFDSAGESWRALEPWGVLKFSGQHFKSWLEGYRSIRQFSQEDEKAVAAFGIVGDLRNVVWKLDLARSSRGKPLLQTSDLPRVVDEWLEWERSKVVSL